MTGEWTFRLGELMLVGDCRFLSEREIEQWIDGELPAARVRAWEAHRRGCPACCELEADIETMRALTAHGLTIASEAKAFAERDARVRRALGLDRSRRHPRRRWFWFGLPAVIATVVLAVVLFRPAPAPLFDGVATVAFVPPPLVRGSAATAWQDAGEAWERGDFEEAARVLEPAWAERPQASDLGFYLGVAQLEAGRAAEAAATLARVAELQRDAPSEWTLWMLAHAQDRAGARRPACDTLASLVELDGERAAEAAATFERGCR